MENQVEPPKTTELDIELQKLEIEKARLNLDMRRERTIKLQLILPLAVSVIALMSTGILELQRSQNESHNAVRIELFKKLTERTTDPEQVRAIYRYVFANDPTPPFWQPVATPAQGFTPIPSVTPSPTPNAR